MVAKLHVFPHGTGKLAQNGLSKVGCATNIGCYNKQSKDF